MPLPIPLDPPTTSDGLAAEIKLAHRVSIPAFSNLLGRLHKAIDLISVLCVLLSI